ncbi:CC/Se motif family (seleno)protein [Natranaerofaba carboxydovora]|uniref:CC/Se motif family (seleno)protein n=1 Tax=Natranaerofaba carboxydovora TaxID=2742683 RepID=UPI001F147D1A|nr:CC/Se motif family (seleno)protein [Natranaerofaba carboxydovora]UMZ74861.1 hypothetical protein ACONDI_02465 [Natranaerofaba carboxydovora]
MSLELEISSEARDYILSKSKKNAAVINETSSGGCCGGSTKISNISINIANFLPEEDQYTKQDIDGVKVFYPKKMVGVAKIELSKFLFLKDIAIDYYPPNNDNQKV